MTAISVVPPPMSMTMLPVGVSTGRPTPIAAAIGSSTIHTPLAPADIAEERTARRSSSVIPGRNADHDARLDPEDPLRGDLLEEVAEHHLRHVNVGDDAVLERANRLDAFRGPPQHPLRLEPDPHDPAAALLHRDHRGLVEHDALALHVHERVRGAEIDGDVVDRDDLRPEFSQLLSSGSNVRPIPRRLRGASSQPGHKMFKSNHLGGSGSADEHTFTATARCQHLPIAAGAADAGSHLMQESCSSRAPEAAFRRAPSRSRIATPPRRLLGRLETGENELRDTLPPLERHGRRVPVFCMITRSSPR